MNNAAISHKCGNCVTVSTASNCNIETQTELRVTVYYNRLQIQLKRECEERASVFIRRLEKNIFEKLSTEENKKGKRQKIKKAKSLVEKENKLITDYTKAKNMNISFCDACGIVLDFEDLTVLQLLQKSNNIILDFLEEQTYLPVMWSGLTRKCPITLKPFLKIGFPVLLKGLMKPVQDICVNEKLKFFWWKVSDIKDWEDKNIPYVFMCTAQKKNQVCYLLENEKTVVVTLLNEGHDFTPTTNECDTTLYVTVHSSLLHCLGFACHLGKVASSTGLSWNDKRFERFSKYPVQDSNAFRIASFNILAPEYARTAEAQFNFFRYCPSHILNFSYRLPLINKELLTLECDIIGLQECSTSTYEQQFLPNFSDRYNIRFTAKECYVPEGLCIFYDKKKFNEIDFCESVFKKSLREDNVELFDTIKKKWPNFVKNVLSKLSTVFQFLVLQLKNDTNKNDHSVLLISNTHLFFHPQASHIRNLQIHVMLCQLENMRLKYLKKGYSVSVICLGDFNSLLSSSAYTYMAKQTISEDNPDWNLFNTFIFGSETTEISSSKAQDATNEQKVSTKIHSLKLNLKWPRYLPKLVDAYENEDERITTLVHNFSGTLDYIFYSPDTLKLLRVLPVAQREDLDSNTGLPSYIYPSDHLCIAIELQAFPIKYFV
ncbi:uncharacterized protein LOC128883703 [Hylaeus volcanicus]|uniref:uncharacterized protein LOC128883703 n=1 Tax=Hylaeus volcanicus TaxID=313075 RepID=UPI0023B7EF45|nr:uncharacterized protein LOC128883703 [Hylaeus volcanicus]